MPHILLVEDDRDLRAAISQLLLDDGFRVTAVSDGLAALLAMGTANPDLIVLDLMMPTYSGWEFLRELRAHHQMSHTPVLVASAFDNAPHELGIQGFMPKPFDLELFLACVRRLSSAPLDCTPAFGIAPVSPVGSGRERA